MDISKRLEDLKWISAVRELTRDEVWWLIDQVEQNQKPYEDEVKEMLIKRQSEWEDYGNEWSKGFVQGVEYVLNINNR